MAVLFGSAVPNTSKGVDDFIVVKPLHRHFIWWPIFSTQSGKVLWMKRAYSKTVRNNYHTITTYYMNIFEALQDQDLG